MNIRSVLTAGIVAAIAQTAAARTEVVTYPIKPVLEAQQLSPVWRCISATSSTLPSSKHWARS